MNSPTGTNLRQPLLFSNPQTPINNPMSIITSPSIDLIKPDNGNSLDSLPLKNPKEGKQGQSQETVDSEDSTTIHDQLPSHPEEDLEQNIGDDEDVDLYQGSGLFGSDDFLPKLEAKFFLQRNIAFFTALGFGFFFTILMITNKMSFQNIFYVAYTYLGYCIVDNYRRSRIARRSFWRVREDSITIIDNIINFVFLACINLKFLGIINFHLVFVTPYFLTTAFYVFLSRGSKNTKLVRSGIRILTTAQVFVITLKLSGIINWRWLFIFTVSGVYWVLVLAFLFSICFAIIYRLKVNDFTFQPSVKGLFWHFFYYSLGILAVLTIVGIHFGFNTKKGFAFLKTVSYVGLILNSFLIVYTLTLFKSLTTHIQEFWLSDNFLLEPLPVSIFEKRQETTFKKEKKERFFKMISSTYFRLLESQFATGDELESPDGRQGIVEPESPGKNEDLCYLCYEKNANAVLGACGHGGVCYDCVVPLVKKKNQCMECRTEVQAIYKIQEREENTTVVKSVESVNIIVKERLSFL